MRGEVVALLLNPIIPIKHVVGLLSAALATKLLPVATGRKRLTAPCTRPPDIAVFSGDVLRNGQGQSEAQLVHDLFALPLWLFSPFNEGIQPIAPSGGRNLGIAFFNNVA